jgi:hypothetical protein
MIATAVLAADYAGTLDLLDTSRIDTRATQPTPIVYTPGPGRLVLAGDVSTIAVARLHLAARRWDYMLAYSSSFSLTDFELGISSQVLQTGTTGIAWHDRFVHVTLSESASYGQLNSAQPYQQPAVPTQATMPAQTTMPSPTTMPGQTAMPAGATSTTLLTGRTPQNFTIASSDTSGSVAFLERRFNVSVGGGYRVSGGLGQDAQAYLPEQYGPRATIGMGYAVSRRDSLSVLATAQNTITPSGECFPPSTTPAQTSCRNDVPIAQLQAIFRRQFSRATSLSVGAGAAVLEAVTEEGQRELVIDPVGTATAIQQLDRYGTNTIALSVQLAPLVDVRTGLPSERIQAAASLSTQVSPSVRIVASSGFLKSLDGFVADPAPITALTGGLEARLHLDRGIDVALGAVAFWQDQPVNNLAAPTPSELSSETGYVSVTALVPTLDF